MERFKDVSTEVLEKMVNERQQFIEKAIAFIVEIAQLIGGTSGFREESFYTTFTKEVNGFGDFSFRYYTTYGSESCTVWHHPGEERIKTNAVAPVLVVEDWYDKKKCQVKVFKESGDWRSALLNVIEHKDELLAQRKKAEEERQAQRLLQSEEERKRAGLLEDAERLKL
jgi:hypothetical protein